MKSNNKGLSATKQMKAKCDSFAYVSKMAATATATNIQDNHTRLQENSMLAGCNDKESSGKKTFQGGELAVSNKVKTHGGDATAEADTFGASNHTQEFVEMVNHGLAGSSDNLETQTTATMSFEGNGTSIAIEKGEFIRFPKLPVELRLKIWKLHQQNTTAIRIIDMVCTENRVLLNYPPPGILHICRESRTEALKQYRLLLSTKATDGPHHIDPTNDTLYVQYQNGHDHEFGIIHNPDFMADGVLSEIKHLAIDYDLWLHLGDHLMQCTLREFTSLEDLTIVLHDGTCSDKWRNECIEVEFIEPDMEILEYRDGEQMLRMEIEGRFQHAELENPAWKRPQFYIKSLARGGKVCCQAYQYTVLYDNRTEEYDDYHDY